LLLSQERRPGRDESQLQAEMHVPGTEFKLRALEEVRRIIVSETTFVCIASMAPCQ